MAYTNEQFERAVEFRRQTDVHGRRWRYVGEDKWLSSSPEFQNLLDNFEHELEPEEPVYTLVWRKTLARNSRPFLVLTPELRDIPLAKFTLSQLLAMIPDIYRVSIPHDGSDECPVPEGFKAQVKLRDGYTFPSPARTITENPAELCWGHNHVNSDIMEYVITGRVRDE